MQPIINDFFPLSPKVHTTVNLKDNIPNKEGILGGLETVEYLSQADKLQKVAKEKLSDWESKQICRYIASNKHEIIQLAKDHKSQSIYISKKNTGLPKSIEIIVKNGE